MSGFTVDQWASIGIFVVYTVVAILVALGLVALRCIITNPPLLKPSERKIGAFDEKGVTK